MQSGKFYREHHAMVTPIVPNREGGPKYVFGRGRGEYVILCTSDLVSRNHCEVYFRDGAFWIKDLKSLNGTYLNDARILPNIERELRFGDRVGLGVSITNTDMDPTDQLCYTFIFQRNAMRMFMGKNLGGPTTMLETPRQMLVVTTRRRIAPNSNSQTNSVDRRLHYRRRRPDGGSGSCGQREGHLQRRLSSRRHQLTQLHALLGKLIFQHRVEQQRLDQELADIAVQVRRTERQRDMLLKMLQNLKKQQKRTKMRDLAARRGQHFLSCKAELQAIDIQCNNSGGENDSLARSVSANNSNNVPPTESVDRENGLHVLAQASEIMLLWEYENMLRYPSPTPFAQATSNEGIFSAANPFFSRPVSPAPSNPPSVPDISNSIDDEEEDSFFE